MRTWFYASRWTARWSALCAICGERRTRLGWISSLASVRVLYSCSINSQRIVESVVLYKHSFRARKVVQMMDLRERREEKRALALIRVGHPKQKKEGKIARLKNYIKSSYRSRCCCCREEKRRKERERVNYGATGNTRPFLLLLLLSCAFFITRFCCNYYYY